MDEERERPIGVRLGHKEPEVSLGKGSLCGIE